MKAFPILLSALLLAACGKSEAPAEPAQNAAEAAPKPAFKVKYIDNNAIAGLESSPRLRPFHQAKNRLIMNGARLWGGRTQRSQLTCH